MGFDTLSGMFWPFFNNSCFNDSAFKFIKSAEYVNPINPQMGGTIGRCCNRIAGGKFQFNEKEYQLTINDKKRQCHLNGGFEGFDKVVWTPHLNKTVVCLS